MKYLEQIFSPQLIEAIGWSIFHSIWQAGVVLILLVIILLFLKETSARIRYIVAYTALLGIMVWSASTGVKAYQYAKEKQVVKEKLFSNPDGMKQEVISMLKSEKDGEVQHMTHKSLKWIKFKSMVQQNFNFILLFWLLGILFLFMRMTGGLVFIMKLPVKQTLPLADKWQMKMENLAIHLSLNKRIRAVQSQIAKVPMVVGQLKPVIIIPVQIFTGLSEKEIEAIIAHELAHIKRNDYLFNIIQSMIETLLFYHPAVWFISKIIRDEREHSCDEIAVQATGDKISYIKALASAQEMSLTNPYNAVAFAQSNGGLLTRVKRLKTLNKMKTKTSEKFLAVGMVFLSLVLLSFTAADYNIEKYSRLDNFENDVQVKPEVVVSRDTIEDKVKAQMLEMEEVSEELERALEVAMSEKDDVMAAEIMTSIEEAMQEIEWEEIQAEAMREVEREMENLNLDSILSVAMREAEAEMVLEIEELKDLELELTHEAIISEAEAMQIAKEAIEVARVTMETIELDTIIEFSINEAFKAIEDLNIGELINDAMDASNDFEGEQTDEQQEQKMKALEEELDALEKKK